MEHNPLATNLRRLRGEADLTQAELAAAAEVDRGTINRIERGKTASPGGGTLTSIAEAIGCSVDELLRQPETPKSRRRGGRR